tara:strand:+ start:2020 stop:2223 length:204 start_codon:yes stop_codon:yes gene_type:complete
MKINIKEILFLIIAIILLYLVSNKYNDYSLNKSISACVIAQKNTSKSKNIEEIKKYCEKEIKKKLSN